jgi:predicted nuclease of predicted toxin-antitoxin system
MRFLVDAQLPRRVCVWLEAMGHDAQHTLDLPQKNETPDHQIIKIAQEEDRVVITKDSDFVQSYMVLGKPKLLLISTGNISNDRLEVFFNSNADKISIPVVEHGFVELTHQVLVVHA